MALGLPNLGPRAWESRNLAPQPWSSRDLVLRQSRAQSGIGAPQYWASRALRPLLRLGSPPSLGLARPWGSPAFLSNRWGFPGPPRAWGSPSFETRPALHPSLHHTPADFGAPGRGALPVVAHSAVRLLTLKLPISLGLPDLELSDLVAPQHWGTPVLEFPYLSPPPTLWLPGRAGEGARSGDPQVWGEGQC